MEREWGGALPDYGIRVAFIVVRLLFIHSIHRWGGFRVAVACFARRWRFSAVVGRNIAVDGFGGAALTGFGFSLVFPALGVEAVKRVPMHNRGTALGVFTGFSHVFVLVGPIAGAVIGAWGYGSAFLFALASVLTALGIVLVLHRTQGE